MGRVKRQPTEEEQKELSDIMSNEPSYVELRGKKVKIGWMHNGTIAKVRKITLGEHKDESMISTKCAAAMLLNGYWKIKLLYWIKWRWMYYFKQYYESELMPIIEEAKKKVPVLQYYINTTSLIGMRDTMIAMTRKEVERFQAGQDTGQGTPQEKKGLG